MVKIWFTDFSCGCTTTNDAERSGRRMEVNTPKNVENIHDMVLADRRVKVRISYGSVISSLHDQCNLILTSLKHLVKPTISCPETADYNALLQDFIMQIIHNPIRISANNYFTINLKFFMGIFANIVTYLVILLQFRKTSNAKVSAIAFDFMSNDTNTTTADMMIANH